MMRRKQQAMNDILAALGEKLMQFGAQLEQAGDWQGRIEQQLTAIRSALAAVVARMDAESAALRAATS
jgi:hypothetical protein